MLNKEQALEMLHKNMQNQNLRRHCYAVGFAMAGIYDSFKLQNKLEDSSLTREDWEVLGILHDADYELTKEDWSQHTLITLEWIKEAGVSEDHPVYKAIQSHNNKVTGLRDPETQLEWALECCDELTGFIVACALVKPDKKLESVDLNTVMKKWPQKAFAKGVIREQIEQCDEKLGIKLEDFVNIVLESMQKNSKELGF